MKYWLADTFGFLVLLIYASNSAILHTLFAMVVVTRQDSHKMTSKRMSVLRYVNERPEIILVTMSVLRKPTRIATSVKPTLCYFPSTDPTPGQLLADPNDGSTTCILISAH